MSRARMIALTSFAMVAFACNSLLCRLALKHTGIDAASFTTIRLASGAAMLWLIVRMSHGTAAGRGNWPSALALFVYAAGFSFAYLSLPAATGALLLFGAVQATMIAHGLAVGERLRMPQLIGVALALGGLVGLLSPGLSAPPLTGSLLMLSAGVAWGVYSLRGKGTGDPTRVTAGNFLRAVPIAAALSALLLDHAAMDGAGVWYALASGALASGVGYAIWYTALPALQSTSAATVQLSVPVLAAIGGIVFLGESLTLRLVLSSVAVLGGIALVILEKNGRVPPGRIDSTNQAPGPWGSDFSGKVSVEKNGRSGYVHVEIDGRRLRFHWEYGGGNCIAMVAVPSELQWNSLDPHREFERDSFLAGLAREIACHECPHATIEIASEAVYFLEPS